MTWSSWQTARLAGSRHMHQHTAMPLIVRLIGWHLPYRYSGRLGQLQRLNFLYDGSRFVVGDFSFRHGQCFHLCPLGQ
jgi:hypothetical protein